MEPFDINNEKYHMGHLIWDGLRTWPDAICQIDAATGERETNASVLRRTVQLARCLRRFGARSGDVLALGGRNHLNLLIPYYTALMVGMPFTGVDPQFKYREIKAHFKICSPKIAFCQKEYLDDYLKAINDLDLDTKLICFDAGEYSLTRFIQEYDDEEDTDFEPLNFDLDQIYGWLLSTGGTTGVIKLAAIKHRTFFKKMMDLKPLIPAFPYNAPETRNGQNLSTLHLSPVQWISAVFGSLTYPAMRITSIMTSAPPTPEHVIDIINKYKPVTATMGPAMVSGILNSKKECDFSCFASITIAGSKIQEKLLLLLQERLRPGARLSEAYGQTENLGPILVPNPSGPIGNCGNCKLEWQKNLKLVDPETGLEIKKPHVPGEMWSKVTCFSEYYNNPKETADAFTDDGWFKTLFLCRTIIPPEIESVILEHPGVCEVSVTSIPHEEDGEHPVACVVRKNGSNVTAQEIKDLVASKRSDSQKLRGGVVFIDEIPLTSTGKIARGKLKQMVLTARRE